MPINACINTCEHNTSVLLPTIVQRKVAERKEGREIVIWWGKEQKNPKEQKGQAKGNYREEEKRNKTAIYEGGKGGGE